MNSKIKLLSKNICFLLKLSTPIQCSHFRKASTASAYTAELGSVFPWLLYYYQTTQPSQKNNICFKNIKLVHLYGCLLQHCTEPVCKELYLLTETKDRQDTDSDVLCSFTKCMVGYTAALLM